MSFRVVVRGAFGVIAPARPEVPYCFLPAFRKSLAFVSRSIFTSAAFHKRTVILPTTVVLGGRIFFAAIHACTVAREIPTAAAASPVVYTFGIIPRIYCHIDRGVKSKVG
jgi:hypothetical protein